MFLNAFSRIFRFAVSSAIIVGAVLFCSHARAGSLETIVKDFSPVSGYVVMARNGDFIIDLDASKGIVEGDLFSVVSPGEKIVHPVTGEVIGSLEEKKAVLRVTRLRDGFSHARAVEGTPEIKAGDPIRRYEDVKAVFWDYSGDGEALYSMLRDELSHLDWENYQDSQKTRPEQLVSVPETGMAVVFLYRDNKLQARDPEFLVLREYAFTEPVSKMDVLSYTKKPSVSVTPKFEPPPVAPVAPPVPSAPPAPSAGPSAESVKPEYKAAAPEKPAYAPVMKESEKPKGVEPVYQQSNLMEQLPGGPVTMADFVPYEDGLLLATTDGKEIRIFKIDEGIVSVTTMESPLHDPILFLSWWFPDPREAPMLTLVHYTEHAPKGSIYALEGNRLRSKAENIKRFIGAFDADGDNMPETLLGQEYDPEDFFDYKIHEVKLIGGKVEYVIPAFKLPNRFTVAGALLADLTGDGQMESVFVRDEILYVYSGIEPLYKSPKQMGGSLNKMVYVIDPTRKHIKTESITMEIPPVAADLDGDGKTELLVVASERNLLANSGISPGIKQTWLAVLKHEEGVFNEGTLGERINTPIQGMTVHDGKVIMIVSETGSIFSGGGKSRLVELPLSK